MRDDSAFGYSKKTGRPRKRCVHTCRSVGNDPEINRRGKQCKNYVCRCSDCYNNGYILDRFCHIHRQKEKVGPLAPNWKGGISKSKNMKFRTVIPEHLEKALARLSENPDLLRSHSEIALLDVRVEELLSQLTSKATSENWNAAAEIVDDVFAAFKEENGDLALRLLKELRTLLRDADDVSTEIWDEIRSTVEQRRKVIDTERRIIESEQVHLRPDKLILIATQISQLVRQYLDEEQYDKFSNEFKQLFFKAQTEQQLIDVK